MKYFIIDQIILMDVHKMSEISQKKVHRIPCKMFSRSMLASVTDELEPE